jgi:hypothetical protein
MRELAKMKMKKKRREDKKREKEIDNKKSNLESLQIKG